MELTVDQALQQGVAAHKEGKLEEAEAQLKKDHQLCAFQILFHNLIQKSLPPCFRKWETIYTGHPLREFSTA